MAYYENNGLEYDESGYEALEARVYQWRDIIMRTRKYDADKALKLAWKYVQHEEHKDPYW